MELIETIDLMTSADYKARFKAEYLQTKIRYKKLESLVEKYVSNTLDFEISCSIDILKAQLSVMGQYLNLLETRAKIEQIELEVQE